LLLGLGVRRLSVDARYIPRIQQTIQALDLKEAEATARLVLQQSRLSEIEKIIPAK
jgi:phosphoenolpyruvate-protein kinase (PTS system EI component)